MELTVTLQVLITFAFVKNFRIYIFLSVSFFLLSACNKTGSNTVFIGGEIINPQTGFVLLMQSERIIDTLFLKGAIKNRDGTLVNLLNPAWIINKYGNILTQILRKNGKYKKLCQT